MSIGLHGLKGEEISFKSGAAFPLNSLAAIRGEGVCTVIEAKRTGSGYKLFHFEMHKKRLKDSAEFLGIPFEKIQGLRNLKSNLVGTEHKPGLLEKCGFDECVVGVYISDLTDNGFDEVGDPRVYVSVYPEKRSADPVHVATTMKYQRVFPSVKTTFYLPGKLAVREAKAQFGPQIGEVIYVNPHTGEVLEGTRSNIFILKKDYEMITPDPSSGKVLPGITLQIVMMLMSEKIYINKSMLKTSDLFSPDTTGIVKTSTTGVVPICSIDGREIPISPKTLTICRSVEEYRKAYYAKSG